MVCAANDVVSRETDELGLVWHTLGVSPQDVARAGVYRREMGRLVKDPFPLPFGAARPDGEAETALRAALAEDPLTRAAVIETRVSRGVAILAGWIDTVGGKVIAERIARLTAGVWDAVNRLTSDDELVGAVRRSVRQAGSIADVVQDLVVRRGSVRLTLLPGGESAAERLKAVCQGEPGVRSVEVALMA